MGYLFAINYHSINLQQLLYTLGFLDVVIPCVTYNDITTDTLCCIIFAICLSKSYDYEYIFLDIAAIAATDLWFRRLNAIAHWEI